MLHEMRVRACVGGLAAVLALTGGVAGSAWAQTPATGTVTFGALLSGANENPPVTTDGIGIAIATLDPATFTLSWEIYYSGLSGAPVAAHFHGPAPASGNSGVQVNFGTELASPVTGSATITPAQFAQLAGGMWYANLHTAANGAGEIRGQMVPVIVLEGTLSGAAENPPVMTDGTGKAIAIYNPATSDVSWWVNYSGLNGGVTNGHFHGPAAPGSNAGVRVPFTNFAMPPFTGMATISPAEAADLLAGLWYANIHSMTSPGGEIRAQMTRRM